LEIKGQGMTIVEAVTQQFNEEIGDQEENPISGRERYQLRMKFGLSAVRLIPSERYLIQKDSRFKTVGSL
jgi:hypothetical protein